MARVNFHLSLPVTFLKEKARFVAYSPTIDLSTSGRTFKQAKERFAEAAMLFFEEIYKKDTIDETLGDLGWEKRNKEWRPPVVVSQEPETISISVR